MTQLNRFKNALASKNFDAAIISSELNQRYLCDFPFTDGYILVTQEQSYIITDFRYEEAIKKTVSGFTVLSPDNSRIDCIAELISNSKAKCVAVEEDAVSISEFNIFSKKLNSIATLKEGASSLLLSQRAIKLDYEIERIKKAQTSRGIDFENGKYLDKLRGLTSLIIPLFISCFDKADELTNAMVARGYDSEMPRSRYNHLSTSRIDFFSCGVFVVCLVTIAILNGVLI